MYNKNERILSGRNVNVIKDLVELEYNLYPYKRKFYRNAHLVHSLGTNGATLKRMWTAYHKNSKRKVPKFETLMTWKDMAKISHEYKKQKGYKQSANITEETQKVVGFRFLGLLAENFDWDYGLYHNRKLNIKFKLGVEYDYLMYIDDELFLIIDITENNAPEDPPKINNQIPYAYFSIQSCTDDDFYGIFRPMRREWWLYKNIKKIVINEDIGASDARYFKSYKNGFPGRVKQS